MVRFPTPPPRTVSSDLLFARNHLTHRTTRGQHSRAASSMQNENATAGVGSEPLSRRPTNSMKMDSPVKLALAICLLSLVSLPADAEVTALRIARQYGVGYLQMMVMENNRLIEKHAKAGGLGDVTLSWSTFADGTVASDAILSGNLDYAAGGLGSFMTLWDRTRGSLGVKGVAALNSMPMLLN